MARVSPPPRYSAHISRRPRDASEPHRREAAHRMGAPHTPRSLLWLLANGSTSSASIELALASMPAGEVDHERRVAPARAGPRPLGDAAGSPIELHRQGYRGCSQQGRRPADRARHRRRPRVAAGRRQLDARWTRADRGAASSPTLTGGDDGSTGSLAHERLDRARGHASRSPTRSATCCAFRRSRRSFLHRAPRARRRTDVDRAADPILAQHPRAAREGRVDDVRSRGARVHGEGARADDPPCRRRRRCWRGSRRQPASGRARSGCRSTLPTSPRSRCCCRRSPRRPAAASLIHGGLGLADVIGLPTDLAAVELLFTSLLVQAQTALAESERGHRVGHSARRSCSPSRGRIGERLREINDAVMTAEAEADARRRRSCRCCAHRPRRSTTSSTERYGKLHAVATPARAGAADSRSGVGRRPPAGRRQRQARVRRPRRRRAEPRSCGGRPRARGRLRARHRPRGRRASVARHRGRRSTSRPRISRGATSTRQ